MKQMKRVISLALSFALLAGYIPAPTHAEDLSQQGLCEHHPEHIDCSYVAAVEAVECGHQHEDTCYVQEENCTHVHDGCGTEELPCEHICDEDTGCITVVLNCPHEHDEECGYTEPVGETPCHYECDICAEEESEFTESSAEVTEVTEVTGPSQATEPIVEVTESTVICNCDTDNEAFHETTCNLYVAPEYPVCYCAEKCAEINTWCDVCGFDYTSCTGEDIDVGYATHYHSVCGTTCSCSNTHSSQIWQPLPTDTTTLTSGNYYLESSITFTGFNELIIDGNVSICLNGNNIYKNGTSSVVTVESGTLALTDCMETGKIQVTSSDKTYFGGGGALCLSGNGSLDMYGGTVSCNALGDAIYCDTIGDLTIYNGTVDAYYEAIGVRAVNDVTIYSGTITSSNSAGLCCGENNSSATFHNITISGGYFEGQKNGAAFGKYTCTGKVTISGGEFYGKGPVPNATTYGYEYYGFASGNSGAGPCNIAISGGVFRGARGGFYNYNPLLNATISGGTFHSKYTSYTSDRDGIRADNGTFRIEGGTIYGIQHTSSYSVDTSITVTGGEILCIRGYGNSSRVFTIKVYDGTIGQADGQVATEGIISSDADIEIYGGTITGTKYAIKNSQSSTNAGGSLLVSGGVLSGEIADIFIGKVGTTAENAYLSMKGYTGSTITVALPSSASNNAYVAKDVSAANIISISDSLYDAAYDSTNETVYLTQHAHTYQEAIISPPTHMSEGIKSFTCTCGDTYNDTIEKLSDHEWDSGAITADPTCTENGIKTFSCPCGETYTEEIALIDHNMDPITGKCKCGLNMAEASVNIGETTTYYQTLGDAVTAATTGTEAVPALLTLQKDVDLGENYQQISSGVLTIDLNGHEISSGYSTYGSYGTLYILGSNTKVTIQDSGDGGAVVGTGFAGNVVYLSKATLIINSGTIRASVTGDAVAAYNSDVIITGGTLGGTQALRAHQCNIVISGGELIGSRYNGGMYVSSSNVNISGGKISYNVSATDGSTLTINGGEIIGNADCNGLYVANSTAIISGGSISSNKCEITTYNASVILTVAEGKGEGARFPSGIKVSDILLNDMLDEGMAYWRDNTILQVADDATEITGSIIIKAKCKHEYTSVETKAPTCTEAGMVTYTCACGDTYTEEIAATGHVLTTVEAVAPTCTETGLTEGKHCSVCNTMLVEQAVIPAKGHTEVIDEALAPTCTQTGLTEGKHCSVCKEIIIAQTKIPAEHNVTNGICTVCGIYGICGEDATWTLIEGVLTVSGTGAMENYGTGEAPWFSHSADIKSAVIDDGITQIANNAFASCTDLTSVTIPDSVTSIGTNAFFKCSNIDSITIPDSVVVIGEYAFAVCRSLNSITIPESVTSLGDGAFADCSSLTSITIPNRVDSIDSMFMGCHSLENVSIPGSVTSMYSAFRDCSSLTSVNILDGVKIICSEAFYDCSSLTNISIPDSVTAIEYDAFHNCSSLSSLIIPDGVTSIGGAFQNCSSLTNIVIPDSVVSMSGAFRGCSKLSGVTIPNGVTSIDGAFQDCSSLTNIVIPDGVTSIDYAFKGCTKLTSITIPDSVTSIDSAFYGCSSLVDVAIPDSVTQIGYDSFYNCSSLTSIIIPGSVYFIREFAFAGCNNLNQIIFEGDAPDFWADPDYYPEIENVAFRDVTATAYYPANNETWTADVMKNYGGTITWVPYTPEHTHEYGDDHKCECGAIGGTCGDNLIWVLSDGMLNISGTGNMEEYSGSSTLFGEPWASYRSQIQTVFIDAGVTSVDRSLFYYNKNLTAIYVDENNPNYSDNDGILFSKDETVLIWMPPVITGTYQIADSVKTIGAYAFSECDGLTSVVIPDSVTSIEYRAFAVLKNLTSVTIGNGVTDIGGGAFYLCSNLTDLILGNSVKEIGDNAFFNCGIISLAIPDSVTTIGQFAFQGCPFTSLNLGNGVQSIGYWAFSQCPNLTSVVLPASVRSIDDGAFWRCRALSEVRFQGEAPDLADEAFSGVNATAYYPANNDTWTEEMHQNYGGTITWVSYSNIENRLILDSEVLSGCNSVWIDGAEMTIQKDGDFWYIDLPDGNARVMTTYTYHVDAAAEDGVDSHRRYPVSMQVWTLENQNGVYSATKQEDFNDILQYSGMAIRVAGKTGIRMITSIDAEKKESLTNDGLAGYTLLEYGTAITWASQISPTKPLVLGKSYVSSNYAYKKDVADPVFRYNGGMMQYTNVLVDFSNEQCADDIAMRPYMILADADGNEITIYGGIVERSIGYIALRNKNQFPPDTDPYDYIWDIIHAVYGNTYDAYWNPTWSDTIM